MNLRRLVRKEIASLQAYEAKEIPCRVKLDANESPFAFPGYLDRCLKVSTNRYPDPEAREIRSRYGKIVAVPEDRILQGNGSDELISSLVQVFGGPVLFPHPTFSMYGILSRILGARCIGVPLDDAFDLDMDRILPALRKEKPNLVFLSSPNNPTGNCFSAERILKIVSASKGIVVLDEAYQPFSSEKGFLPLLDDYPNLVILRTLSKIGLASLRLGFLVAREDVVREVNKVRLPFNVNSLSQAVAAAALKDWKRISRRVRDICRERDRLFSAMQQINGITVYPSEANFLLFRVKDADRMHAALLKQGVLVRNMAAAVRDCLRVTVGNPDENAAFLHSLARAAAGARGG